MNVIRMALAACALVSAPAYAGQATINWDYGTGAITGFRVYCAAVAGQWPAVATAITPASQKTTPITFTGRTYCVVRAYDSAGESPDSNVITLLEAPTNLRIASQQVYFDPNTERVEMQAQIIELQSGDVKSTVNNRTQ